MTWLRIGFGPTVAVALSAILPGPAWAQVSAAVQPCIQTCGFLDTCANGGTCGPPRIHLGTDYAACPGQVVYAPVTGTVTDAHYHEGYGGTVVIDTTISGEPAGVVVGHLMCDPGCLTPNDARCTTFRASGGVYACGLPNQPCCMGQGDEPCSSGDCVDDVCVLEDGTGGAGIGGSGGSNSMGGTMSGGMPGTGGGMGGMMGMGGASGGAGGSGGSSGITGMSGSGGTAGGGGMSSGTGGGAGAGPLGGAGGQGGGGAGAGATSGLGGIAGTPGTGGSSGGAAVAGASGTIGGSAGSSGTAATGGRRPVPMVLVHQSERPDGNGAGLGPCLPNTVRVPLSAAA